jgi:hypothetical protein
MIRFTVFEIRRAGAIAFVLGRLHEGIIRVGSRFTRVEGTEGMTSELSTSNLSLRVELILIFDFYVGELHTGMESELTVMGENIAQLEKGPFPFDLVGESIEPNA